MILRTDKGNLELVGKHSDPEPDALPAFEFEVWSGGYPAFAARTIDRAVELAQRNHRPIDAIYEVRRVSVDRQGVPL